MKQHSPFPIISEEGGELSGDFIGFRRYSVGLLFLVFFSRLVVVFLGLILISFYARYIEFVWLSKLIAFFVFFVAFI